MIPLKSDFTYAILDSQGMAKGGVPAAGFYRHDTRHLSQYTWTFADLELLGQSVTATSVTQHWSRMDRHGLEVMVERRLELRPTGFSETFRIENWSDRAVSLDLKLELEADFADIFEVRGHQRRAPRNPVTRRTDGNSQVFAYVAQDGVVCETRVELGDEVGLVPVEVPPRGVLVRQAEISFATTLPAAAIAPEATLRWSPNIDVTGLKEQERRVLNQAVMDIESLLLNTPDGLTVAAGIPNFVVPFGRDSLITAWLLLDVDPSLARSVLIYLARRQGTKVDHYRDEEVGKIMHEHRECELARIGEIPFRTYYGSADSTPLFIVLLNDYVARTGDLALARELEANWRAAIEWVRAYADGDGLIRFRRRTDGHGLTVQSWKDSFDSMSYSDGMLAETGLAGVEVQGYVFAALMGAAELSRISNGSEEERETWRRQAIQLAETVDRLFWMPEHNTYALALDDHGRQLNVIASNTGHLLWSGVVPEAKVGQVIERLFAEDLWSGYGLRTLSTKEKRYNPLSYHNGSVWPHDTALVSAGLLRHGDVASYATVRDGLVAVASHSADLRLPELFGGYPREGTIPPLPYLKSCRPQAWAAAALIFMLTAGRARSADVAAESRSDSMATA